MDFREHKWNLCFMKFNTKKGAKFYSKCPEESEADAEPDDLPGAEAADPDSDDYERLRELLLECNTHTHTHVPTK
jgi:hypothetical protein